MRALSNQVITEQDYKNISSINEINYNKIDRDHNFEKDARSKLVKYTLSLFS